MVELDGGTCLGCWPWSAPVWCHLPGQASCCFTPSGDKLRRLTPWTWRSCLSLTTLAFTVHHNRPTTPYPLATTDTNGPPCCFALLDDSFTLRSARASSTTSSLVCYLPSFNADRVMAASGWDGQITTTTTTTTF